MNVKQHKMGRFFSRLSYSFGNEDWRTEREALQIKPSDNVLCISASGDRSLHLLLDECNHLTSIDANPIQNHLLSLKSAALGSLEYDEYIHFLGGVHHGCRENSFHKVIQHLPHDSASFWTHNKKMINKGVLYQGMLERVLKVISSGFKLTRSGKIKKILEIDNIEEQRAFLKHWDTLLFRKFFEFVLSKKVCKVLAFDPGLYAHTDKNLSLGSYIYSRMMKSLNHTLAKDNLLFTLLFNGRVDPSAFPPYLHPESFDTIRARLDRLTIKTDDINDHLEQMPANSYDRFSLSDVASYLSKDNFNRLIKNVHRTAKPGARFCIRQFSSNQVIPEEFQVHFKRESTLEKRLEDQDCCFVYRFMVGEIAK